MGKGAKKRRSLVNMNSQVAHCTTSNVSPSAARRFAESHIRDTWNSAFRRLKIHAGSRCGVMVRVTRRMSGDKSRLVTNRHQESSGSGRCSKAQFALKTVSRCFCDLISDARRTTRGSMNSDTSPGRLSSASRTTNRSWNKRLNQLIILDGFRSRFFFFLI